MRKTHRVVGIDSYDSDSRDYFKGTAEECQTWINDSEHPEYYRVGFTLEEQARRNMCRRLFGDGDALLNERDEKALNAALEMKAGYDKRLDKSAESAGLFMEDFVNNYGCPMTAFIDEMTRKHRTLQQSFTKLCLKWIEKVASPEYTFDGRNEASHRTCIRLMDNWLLKHPYDNINMADEQMLRENPPSKWLPMV